jgi:hypothetical protein
MGARNPMEPNQRLQAVSHQQGGDAIGHGLHAVEGGDGSACVHRDACRVQGCGEMTIPDAVWIAACVVLLAVGAWLWMVAA